MTIEKKLIWKLGDMIDDFDPEQGIEITDDEGNIHATACDRETAQRIIRAVNLSSTK